jgi:hypothetical protein
MLCAWALRALVTSLPSFPRIDGGGPPTSKTDFTGGLPLTVAPLNPTCPAVARRGLTGLFYRMTWPSQRQLWRTAGRPGPSIRRFRPGQDYRCPGLRAASAVPGPPDGHRGRSITSCEGTASVTVTEDARALSPAHERFDIGGCAHSAGGTRCDRSTRTRSTRSPTSRASDRTAARASLDRGHARPSPSALAGTARARERPGAALYAGPYLDGRAA